SWQEMQQLLEMFPEKISFELAEIIGCIEGGIIWFHFPAATVAQYLATTEKGQNASVLSALIDQAHAKAMEKRIWLSLGTSSKKDGTINADLHRFKSMFGGGAVVHSIYQMHL
ncbi:MAG: hypothetical protein OXC81_07715, partial [Betaproteobacteria bacterium]|nr:hypothetical protein [Betaproteobacteria bacterium]